MCYLSIPCTHEFVMFSSFTYPTILTKFLLKKIYQLIKKSSKIMFYREEEVELSNEVNSNYNNTKLHYYILL